jgi:hypothetical protein
MSPDFKVGEQVFVKAKYFRSTRLSKKLLEKNLGPFEIIAHLRSHSITVRLPDSMCSVHPVFHVSQLEPATPNTIPNRIQLPPPPVEVNGEPEYEISEILDSKLDRWRHKDWLRHAQLISRCEINNTAGEAVCWVSLCLGRYACLTCNKCCLYIAILCA